MMTSRQLEALLQNPASYPHPVRSPIHRIETHISTVWLTGDYAYKVKKPVDFGFVDFSTRARRCRFCEAEVRLNRRFAPEIYLQRVWITPEGIRLTPPATDDAPFECAVQMRQFDPDRVLSRYLNHHRLTPTQLSTLGRTLAQFHQQAERVDDHQPWGQPDTVLQPMEENFPVLYPALPAARDRLDRLADWTQDSHATLKQTLAERRAHGFIRACHGDLHLDNLVMIDDVPVPFDGIEFNERFRWIDPVSDLAFLLMALDHVGQRRDALWLLNTWLQETGDFDGMALLRFYGTYRALVRAKIATLQAGQQTGTAQRRLLTEAEAFIKTACHWSLQLPRPFLIVMHGLSGSGKSHYARTLAQSLGAVIISSDVERKRLAGLAPTDRPDSEAARERLYAPAMSARTYDRLLNAAETLLKAGIPVILDATYLKVAHRARPLALAQSLNVPAQVFALQADPTLCRQQITLRQHRGNDPSDADEAVMIRQHATIEPPDETVEPVWWQPAGQPLDVSALRQRLTEAGAVIPP